MTIAPTTAIAAAKIITVVYDWLIEKSTLMKV